MDTTTSLNFTAIKHIDSKELTVVWDLGRRCTYDCSYCTPHWHNNFSPFVTKEPVSYTHLTLPTTPYV